MLRFFFIIIFTIQLISCGGGDDGSPMMPISESEVVPFVATLLFPENNTECNEGVIVSDTESKVVFKWNVSENTDFYTVNLKNLNSNVSVNLNSNSNELEINLLRGFPYSWSVISNANGSTKTAETDKWKFYNTGPATENFAPFPADLISPGMGSSINSGMIELSWLGLDLDDDIQSYDIYIDSNDPPTTLFENSTSTSLEYIATSSITYYWIVVTKDSEGNSSNSEVFQFKTN